MGCFGIRAITTTAVVAILLLTAPHAASAITCIEVGVSMKPCLEYLNDRQSLSEACCSSVKSLNSMVTDREEVCKCLNQVVTWIADMTRFYALPDKCGVEALCTDIVSTGCSKVTKIRKAVPVMELI